MKILIDRDILEACADALDDAEIFVNTCSEAKRNRIKTLYNHVKVLLGEPIDYNINRQIPNSNWKLVKEDLTDINYQTLIAEIAHLRGQVSDLFGKVKDMQTKIDKPKLNLSEAYHRQAISQELNNKYIIVEMLDIIKTLDKQLVYCSNEGYSKRQHIPTELQKQIDKLKNKIVGKI